MKVLRNAEVLLAGVQANGYYESGNHILRTQKLTERGRRAGFEDRHDRLQEKAIPVGTRWKQLDIASQAARPRENYAY
jgi:hypothetical protein